MALPPGPGGLPIIGDPNMFSEESIHYVRAMNAKYGNIFRLNFGPNVITYLTEPKYLQYVLTDNAANFLNAPVGKLMGGPIYGDGVLFIDGAMHKQARRMMQPAFHKKRVESYMDRMVEETEHILQSWSGEINIGTAMHQLTLNIVARVLFNIDLRTKAASLTHAWDDIMTHNGDFLGVILSRVPFSNRRRGTDVMNDLITNMLEDRRANPHDVGDVLSMLLDARDEDGTTFDDKQIRDHLFVLLLAGHETSANGLTWAFYLLAQHPDWASRLVDEIKTVLGDRTPTYADLDNMPVLDMVVRETLRLMPPVPGFLREVVADCEIDGYEIPGGSLVYYYIFGTHRLPDLYPEPKRWKPERFAADAPRKYSPYEYLPFGASTRLCLGMPMAMLEMKTILAMTLQKYRLDVVPDQNVTVVFRGTLGTRDGIRMRVNPQDGRTGLSPAHINSALNDFVDLPIEQAAQNEQTV